MDEKQYQKQKQKLLSCIVLFFFLMLFVFLAAYTCHSGELFIQGGATALIATIAFWWCG
ncbi:hypothetical protein ACFL3G_13425 [Planctomycetota bacterium]